MKKYLTHDTSNQGEYNKDITLYELKRATKALKNHKQEGPDKVRNEFLKYGGEVQAQTLQTFFKIFDSEDIPHQWKISMLINIGKGKKDNEKLENKRGISLCNNSKLSEKIIVNRLNKDLNFTEAQAGATPQNSTLNKLFTLKAIIRQRKHEEKETYVAFIGIKKAYDKVWSNAILYLP